MTRKNNDGFTDNRISAKYHPNYRTMSIFDSTIAAMWKIKTKQHTHTNQQTSLCKFERKEKVVRKWLPL